MTKTPPSQNCHHAEMKLGHLIHADGGVQHDSHTPIPTSSLAKQLGATSDSHKTKTCLVPVRAEYHNHIELALSQVKLVKSRVHSTRLIQQMGVVTGGNLTKLPNMV